jgi:hypothetical protein
MPQVPDRQYTPDEVERAPRTNLNEFFRLCRNVERESGFPNVDDLQVRYDARQRSMFLEKTALIVSEIGEMIEIARKGTLDGLAMRVEVADLIIRLGALGAACGMDEALLVNSGDRPWTDADHDELQKLRPWLGDGSIDDVLRAKSCYNTQRPIKHGKAL